MTNPQNKSNQWLAKFLVCFGLLILLFLFIYEAPQPSSHLKLSEKKQFSSQEFDLMVSHYLQTSRTEDEVQNEESNAFRETIAEADLTQNQMADKPKPPQLDIENPMADVTEHVQNAQGSHTHALSETPDAFIGQQLRLDQSTQELGEDYRTAYVEEFLKKARRAGLLVKLNENLVVTSVTKLSSNRVPQSVTKPKNKKSTDKSKIEKPKADRLDSKSGVSKPATTRVR